MANTKDAEPNASTTPPAQSQTPPSTPPTTQPSADPPAPANIAEIERIARGVPHPSGMVSPEDAREDPVKRMKDEVDTLSDRGLSRFEVTQEKKSTASLLATADRLLDKAGTMLSPEDPRRFASIDESILDANERISRTLADIQLPPDQQTRDRNGLTAAERIRTHRDETIPGGYYRVNGVMVNANGRPVE